LQRPVIAAAGTWDTGHGIRGWGLGVRAALGASDRRSTRAEGRAGPLLHSGQDARAPTRAAHTPPHRYRRVRSGRGEISLQRPEITAAGTRDTGHEIRGWELGVRGPRNQGQVYRYRWQNCRGVRISAAFVRTSSRSLSPVTRNRAFDESKHSRNFTSSGSRQETPDIGPGCTNSP